MSVSIPLNRKAATDILSVPALQIPEIDNVGCDDCGEMFFVPFFHRCIRCARLLLQHALDWCFPQLTSNGQPRLDHRHKNGPALRLTHWPRAVLPSKLAAMLARRAPARPRASCTRALRHDGPLFPRYVLAHQQPSGPFLRFANKQLFTKSTVAAETIPDHSFSVVCAKRSQDLCWLSSCRFSLPSSKEWAPRKTQRCVARTTYRNDFTRSDLPCRDRRRSRGYHEKDPEQ